MSALTYVRCILRNYFFKVTAVAGVRVHLFHGTQVDGVGGAMRMLCGLDLTQWQYYFVLPCGLCSQNGLLEMRGVTHPPVVLTPPNTRLGGFGARTSYAHAVVLLAVLTKHTVLQTLRNVLLYEVLG